MRKLTHKPAGDSLKANDSVVVVNALLYEDLKEALVGLAIRFPAEFKTTLTKCTCLQFEDSEHCRHMYALQVLKQVGWKMR